VPAPIDFYFEFASPYGYFASLRIDAIAAAYEREVTWRPIMLGAALKLTGGGPNMHLPLKGPYLLRDAPRFARLLDIPFKQPPVMPMNSLAASRAYWWLFDQDQDLAKGLAECVYHAHWGEGRDMSTAEQVAEVAETLGLARQDLVAAVQDPAVKGRLKEETDRSLERGVFGSPFIFVDDEPFWGADRIDQAERWLRTGGW
jgi:2-hydroxychromene-2-carboxylate isomerase